MKSQFYANVTKVALIVITLLVIVAVAMGLSFAQFALIIIVLSLIALIPIKLHLRKINETLQKEKEEKLQREQAQEDERHAKHEESIKKENEVKGRILSNMPYKPSDLVTVCNVKQKVVWNGEMKTAIDVSREIFYKSFDDKELNKTIKFLTSVLNFIEKKKTGETVYVGEERIKKDIKECLLLARI